MDFKKILIDKINKSEWWHVRPRDPDAYKKREKFLASTFEQAEFYGRPCDIPERVSISNPVFGFSEKEILQKLFPSEYKTLMLKNEDFYNKSWYEDRINLDAKMLKKAKLLKYDSIVLMGANGKKYLEKNRKPRSIELNLLNV